MAISTIGNIQPINKQKNITPVLTYILGVICVALLVFFGGEIIKNLDKLGKKAAVTIDSLYEEAEVFIDGKSLGITPFESEKIKPGENKVTIKGEKASYETTINFIPSTDKKIHNVGIFRDLGISDMFSSGQEFWFEKDDSGNTLRVVSNPSGASVFIDGSEVGKTPFSSNDLSEDSYDLEVAYPGYEKQTARINIKKGYTLNVNIKLFPSPIPSSISMFEGSSNLYDLSSDNNQMVSDTSSWVRGVIYWNKTRGIDIGNGVNKELVFDYYLDYKGNLYNKDGDKVEIADLNNIKRGAYLGRLTDGSGLTKEAKEVFLKLTSQVTITSDTQGGKNATILDTGLGWLRVRSTPNLNGSEITKVNVGNVYLVTGEQPGWVKIKISDAQEGWVSSQYVQIK